MNGPINFQNYGFNMKQDLQEVLDEIVHMRATIRDEVLNVEKDLKEGGQKDFLNSVHRKKTYQSMGLTMAETIIRKRIDNYER